MKQLNLTNHDLLTHWLLAVTFTALVVVYNFACETLGTQLQINIDENQRILLRSIFYSVTIILFPLSKLVRHILIKLNQTMPGNKSPQQRYFITVVFSMALVELSGMFGFLMFVLGDGFNTLYIFSILAILGIFLHKPDFSEYQTIVSALKQKSESLFQTQDKAV